MALVRFGAFAFDLRSGALRKGGLPFKLQPRPASVLALLVSRPGQLVTRDEIRRQVWGDGSFVGFELSLNTCIRQVRVALGDSAEKPRFVETLPRRGYRFIAPVERTGPEGAEGEGPTAAPTPGGPVPRAVALTVAAVVLLVAGLLARSAPRPSSPGPAAPVRYQRLTFGRGGLDPVARAARGRSAEEDPGGRPGGRRDGERLGARGRPR